MDKLSFAKKMFILSEATNGEVKNIKVDIYYEQFKNCSDADINKGFKAAMLNCKFFPSISELNSYISPQITAAEMQVIIFNAQRDGKGYDTPNDVMRSYLGERAWAVVEAFHGWKPMVTMDEKRLADALTRYCKGGVEYDTRRMIE